MKIKSTQSFKAQLSPEVKKGFYEIIKNADERTQEGKKTLKGMQAILNCMPQVSISIRKYNLQGDEYYGYEMKNPHTGTSTLVSYMERSKMCLFSKNHISNIQYALADEYIKEYKPIATEESQKTGMLDTVYKKIFG